MSDDGEVALPKAQRVLGAVFGVAMTAIGLICCFIAVRFPADLAAHDAFLDQLARDGATIRATLSDKRVETTSTFPIGSRGGRSTSDSVVTRYAYRFETPSGEIVSGRSTISGALPDSAKTVLIYYAADDPRKHAPFHEVEQDRLGLNVATLTATLAVLLAGAFAALFGGFGFRLLRAAYRGRAKPTE